MFSPKEFLRERLFGKRLPLKDVFGLFKKVLDSNNHALEVITDMGEKLGGDYIFDVVYVRQAHSSLTAFMENSISSFDELTQGRYSRLRDVFARIDALLYSEISGPATTSSRLVLPYGDITADLSREVGGKNAALAELKNHAHLKVPAAFAITTSAFELFMRHNGLGAKVKDAPGGADEAGYLEALRAMIEAADIPPELGAAIDYAVNSIKDGQDGEYCLAVRSSAEEEDGEYSFAGQFASVLNVPASREAVEAAYKKVVASLYSPGAVAYQRKLGYSVEGMKMAVGCVAMVDAVSSGVIYTASPDKDKGKLLITAAWGLGVSVVEGRVDSDRYTLRKPGYGGGHPEIISKKAGEKRGMVVSLPGGDTGNIDVPDEKAGLFCLSDEQAMELASLAVNIEKHMGGPQDIEWALGTDGFFYILQSRPLKLAEIYGDRPEAGEVIPDATILMSGRGIPVQHGAGGGSVFILRREDDLDRVPDGAVLVSTSDSSSITRVMPRISAIITDVGGTTSHMASVCREFRLPTLVNTGDATKTLKDGQPVTLYIDEDGNAAVYEGIMRGVVEHAQSRVFGMEGVHEYRKKRALLRRISPLNLVDPLMDEFTPEGCRTVHDILRFIHEKSVAELVENARQWGEKMKGRAPVKLDLPIPAGIVVIDIGGGLSAPAGGGHVSIDDVSSLPLKAIVRGMTHPGVWHSDIVSLTAGDFMSSMMRMPDITANAGDYAGYNVAVASGDYVNLGLKFGYHFNMLDCYMSPNARNNHIYFRFTGGATDITKRSRRIHLISLILDEFGFNTKTQGDLIIARLSNLTQERMEVILDQLGRLVSYTRQLDAMLHTDEAVETYARNFMEGNY